MCRMYVAARAVECFSTSNFRPGFAALRAPISRGTGYAGGKRPSSHRTVESSWRAFGRSRRSCRTVVPSGANLARDCICGCGKNGTSIAEVPWRTKARGERKARPVAVLTGRAWRALTQQLQVRPVPERAGGARCGRSLPRTRRTHVAAGAVQRVHRALRTVVLLGTLRALGHANRIRVESSSARDRALRSSRSIVA